VDYKETYDDSDTSITTYVPAYDYIVSIMRYSVMGAFGGVVGGWVEEPLRINNKLNHTSVYGLVRKITHKSFYYAFSITPVA